MYPASNSSRLQLPELARCQHACFPDSFGTKLGLAYTIRSLEWFLAENNRFLFHIEEKGKVIGYCGGYIPLATGDGSTSGMMRYAMHEAVKGMMKKPWLFFQKEIIPFYPLILKNIYRKMTGYRTKQIYDVLQNAGQEQRCGLVVVGVHPDYRGKGFFELLMNEFERQALIREINYLVLSVKVSNNRGINAYRKCGWLIAEEFKNEIKMYKHISQNECQ